MKDAFAVTLICGIALEIFLNTARAEPCHGSRLKSIILLGETKQHHLNIHP